MYTLQATLRTVNHLIIYFIMNIAFVTCIKNGSDRLSDLYDLYRYRVTLYFGEYSLVLYFLNLAFSLSLVLMSIMLNLKR